MGVTSYIILVGSKFVILEVIDIVFSDRGSFTGPWNGVVVFIVLVFTILAAEFFVNRIYHYLKSRSGTLLSQ